MTVDSLEKEFPGVAWPTIFGMAKSMAYDSDNRDDLIQVAVLAVLRSYPDASPAYYTSSAKNAMLDARKYEGRHQSRGVRAHKETAIPSHEDVVVATVIADDMTKTEKLYCRAIADNMVARHGESEIGILAKESGIPHKTLGKRVREFQKKVKKKWDETPKES